MLRIKVELVPFGDENEKRDIGQLLIANTLKKGHIDPSCYVYDAYLSADHYTGVGSRVASVEHLQYEGVWMLVRKALEALDQDAIEAANCKDQATDVHKHLATKAGDNLGRTE